MTDEKAHTLTVTFPEKFLPWARERAEEMGLPSPENFLLLVVQQAWQRYHFDGEQLP